MTREKSEEKQEISLTKGKGQIRIEAKFFLTPRQFWTLLVIVLLILAVAISSMSGETRDFILHLLAGLLKLSW